MTEAPGQITPADGASSDSATYSGYFAKSLRGTWRAMNEWGDEVERKHFRGDFIKTISSAPQESLSKIAGSIDNLQVDDRILMMKDVAVDVAKSVQEGVQEISKRRASEPPLPAARALTNEELGSHASVIRSYLDKVKSEHPLRAADLAWLAGEVDRLRTEVNEEQELLREAERERSSINVSLEDAWRELEDLQERHQALLSRRTSLEVEVRRETLSADLAAQAAKQARQEGMDPETEALKDAKLLLAEVLTQVDEARLQSRKELSDLQLQITHAQTEHAQLMKANSEEDFFAPRRGLFSLPF